MYNQVDGLDENNNYNITLFGYSCDDIHRGMSELLCEFSTPMESLPGAEPESSGAGDRRDDLGSERVRAIRGTCRTVDPVIEGADGRGMSVSSGADVVQPSGAGDGRGDSTAVATQEQSFLGNYDEGDRSVQERLDRMGTRLYSSISASIGGNVRRILHDTVSFVGGDQGKFECFVQRIQKSLSGCDWSVIAFHPDDRSQYQIKTKYKEAVDIYRRRADGDEVVQTCWYQGVIGSKTFQVRQGVIRYRTGAFWDSTDRLGLGTIGSGHFHILHPCAWYNYQCGHLSRAIDVLKRKPADQQHFPSSEQHFKNTLFYIGKYPRWLVYSKMPDGQEQYYVFGTEYIPESDLREGDQYANPLEEGDPADKGVLRRRRSNSGSGGEDSGRGSKKNKPSSRNGGAEAEGIIKLFLKNPTFPLENILRTRLWDMSEFATFIASDKTVQRAVALLMNRTCKWSYDDYITLYNQEDVHPLFGAIDQGNTHELYYNVPESVDIALELLDYQLESNEAMSAFSREEKRGEFVSNVFAVCEKIIPKRNAIMVVSPPSGGKNYFFDAIMAFYLNVGIIQNFNKFNNFPLMEAINRRINCWNEPNVEPSAFDTVKMLLAGDPLKAAVKYQSEQPLLRTPVIVLSNKWAFPKNQAFEDRMFVYTWRRAEFLKEYKKKLNPFMWPALVHRYENVIYNKFDTTVDHLV